MKGKVVDKARFEAVKKEYYQLRRWDSAPGLPTESSLNELGLADTAADLKPKNR